MANTKPNPSIPTPATLAVESSQPLPLPLVNLTMSTLTPATISQVSQLEPMATYVARSPNGAKDFWLKYMGTMTHPNGNPDQTVAAFINLAKEDEGYFIPVASLASYKVRKFTNRPQPIASEVFQGFPVEVYNFPNAVQFPWLSRVDLGVSQVQFRGAAQAGVMLQAKAYIAGWVDRSDSSQKIKSFPLES